MFNLVRRDLAVPVRINRGQDRRPELWTRSVRTPLTVARTLTITHFACALVARPILATTTIFGPCLVAALLTPIVSSRPFFLASSVIPRAFLVAPSVLACTVLIRSGFVTRPCLIPPSILAPLFLTTLCIATIVFGSRFVATGLIAAATIITRLVIASLLLATAPVVARFIAVRVPLFSGWTIARIAVPRLILSQARHAPCGRADQHQSQRVLTHYRLL
jgi:hypothetical protein